MSLEEKYMSIAERKVYEEHDGAYTVYGDGEGIIIKYHDYDGEDKYVSLDESGFDISRDPGVYVMEATWLALRAMRDMKKSIATK